VLTFPFRLLQCAVLGPIQTITKVGIHEGPLMRTRSFMNEL
jgi:hypothetical protein